ISKSPGAHTTPCRAAPRPRARVRKGGPARGCGEDRERVSLNLASRGREQARARGSSRARAVARRQTTNARKHETTKHTKTFSYVLQKSFRGFVLKRIKPHRCRHPARRRTGRVIRVAIVE